MDYQQEQREYFGSGLTFSKDSPGEQALRNFIRQKKPDMDSVEGKIVARRNFEYLQNRGIHKSPTKKELEEKKRVDEILHKADPKILFHGDPKTELSARKLLYIQKNNSLAHRIKNIGKKRKY